MRHLVRWLGPAVLGLAGFVVAELSKPWIMRTFEVDHPGLVVFPVLFGLFVLWVVGKSVRAFIQGYRGSRPL